jgi:hypothetical protein
MPLLQLYKPASSQSINQHPNHQPKIRNVEKPKDFGRLVELWIPRVESHAHLFVGKGMALQKMRACYHQVPVEFSGRTFRRPAGEFFILIERLRCSVGYNDFDFFLQNGASQSAVSSAFGFKFGQKKKLIKAKKNLGAKIR